MAKIVANLQEINWHLVVNLDDFGHRGANSCMFFWRAALADQRKRIREVFIFSPSGEGSILLIDVPESTYRARPGAQYCCYRVVQCKMLIAGHSESKQYVVLKRQVDSEK